MRRKLVLAALTAVVLATVAGAYTLAETVGGDDGASTFASLIDRPPGGSSCVCPALFQPVICTRENPDGTTSRQVFSNGCIAACHGYTSCARIIAGP